MTNALQLFIKRAVTFWLLSLAMYFPVLAQSGSTASELASQMTIGWNIGNSLEVPGGETGWGNPVVDQQLVDAVKAAGFNTIRIPCAWDSYANQSTYEIDPAWLARVREVVDYGINNNMFVILNSHWDGGWLEEHPFYANQAEVNAKQEAYWTQIANYFISYDEHLLFAGTNEVRADYGTPTAEHIEVQESYNQTFVDAVRATGGNNGYRKLIVQTYNTNAWHGLDYFTLPNDVISNRLFVEIHHYDPYDFTLNTNNKRACTLWGQPWAGGDVCSWGQEDYHQDLFNQVKQRWMDIGVPVIIGEYGVVKRTSLSGTAYDDHVASREYYLEYVTNAARTKGIIPVYWDNGYNGDMGFALFDRGSGQVVDPGALNALMVGAGVSQGETYTLTTNTNGAGAVSLSPAGGAYSAGTIVTITATPDSGWDFDSWSGDLTGSTNPTTITMNTNQSVTANFLEASSGNVCDNAVSISAPFTQNGAGEYCWLASGKVSYVASSDMDILEINGVDYTNVSSGTLPGKIQGNYEIYYKATLSSAHFEIWKSGGGGRLEESGTGELSINQKTVLYPNPFKETIQMGVDNPDLIKKVEILDLAGKILFSTNHLTKGALIIGENLKTGTYILQVETNDQEVINYRIVKD